MLCCLTEFGQERSQKRLRVIGVTLTQAHINANDGVERQQGAEIRLGRIQTAIANGLFSEIADWPLSRMSRAKRTDTAGVMVDPKRIASAWLAAIGLWHIGFDLRRARRIGWADRFDDCHESLADVRCRPLGHVRWPIPAAMSGCCRRAR